MAKYAAETTRSSMRLAEESFRRALAINPELSLAHYLYAQLEMETGRSLDALRAAARSGARAPRRPAVVRRSGAGVPVCRAARGLAGGARAGQTARPDDQDEHRVHLDHVGRLHAAVDDARANQDPVEGFALAAARRGDEAREVLQKARRQYGTNPTWATYFDMVLAFERGDKTATASLAEACLRFPFRDPEGMFHVCLVLAG